MRIVKNGMTSILALAVCFSFSSSGAQAQMAKLPMIPYGDSNGILYWTGILATPIFQLRAPAFCKENRCLTIICQMTFPVPDTVSCTRPVTFFAGTHVYPGDGLHGADPVFFFCDSDGDLDGCVEVRAAINGSATVVGGGD